MDKWLEKDVEEFCGLMGSKGYTGSFLVNNRHSGTLMEAVKKCATAAEGQGYPMCPLIVHTAIRVDGPNGTSLLRLRLDQADEGIKIRDAVIESVKVNGITKYGVEVSFANTARFPTSDELMEKVKNKFIKKNKIKKGL